MKRIFLHSHRSLGKFPDGRVRLDAYFRTSDGEEYVWTPDWKRVTNQFFLEAYQIEELNRPQSVERQRYKEVVVRVPGDEVQKKEPVNFRMLALKLGEALRSKTSRKQINDVASMLFDFDASTHRDFSITNIHSQEIYDWIMTLGEQPLSREKKLELLKKFIGTLAPKDNPLRKLA